MGWSQEISEWTHSRVPRTRGHRRDTSRGPRGSPETSGSFPPVLGSMAADSIHRNKNPGTLSTGLTEGGLNKRLSVLGETEGENPRLSAEEWSSRGKRTSCDKAWLPARRPHRHLSVAMSPAAASWHRPGDLAVGCQAKSPRVSILRAWSRWCTRAGPSCHWGCGQAALRAR